MSDEALGVKELFASSAAQALLLSLDSFAAAGTGTGSPTCFYGSRGRHCLTVPFLAAIVLVILDLPQDTGSHDGP